MGKRITPPTFLQSKLKDDFVTLVKSHVPRFLALL